jgi:phospholipid/cholesterol/gamma-HCH transport system ATP-binding protein
MSTAENNSVIAVGNLVKKFDSTTVLDNVSLTAVKGKTTVIIGPSGCGKTVLVKHMIALERPTSGHVYYKGRAIDELARKELVEVRKDFGFLFQGGALFDSMNVYNNIVFPIRQHSGKITDWNSVNEVVKHKLALVGMDGYQEYFPASLSGGQQKRVALARAIAMDPEVIFYDEPTTGLDPIRSDIINELILKLQREMDVTSIVVTHDMKSAYKIADRIVMLYDGRVIADGDADYIKSHPHPKVQQFINGRIGEADLAALRLGGTKYKTQYSEDDFKQS